MIPTRSPGLTPRLRSKPATLALASLSARYVIAALSTRTATRPPWTLVVSVRFFARFVTMPLSAWLTQHALCRKAKQAVLPRIAGTLIRDPLLRSVRVQT